MRQITLFALLVISCMLTAQAQKTIHGKVTDLNNNPLSGASISFADRSSVTTDANGAFSFACGRSNRITVSYVGFETSSVSITNCDALIAVQLAPANQTLGEVEITATSNPNRRLLYQPASITKLGATELKRGTGLFLDDAINSSVTGVIMSRRSLSGGQQINIRGYGSGSRGTAGVSSNFDIQGVKVYLNGIPLTDAEGITALDDIDFGSIGNAEVLKGPAGTLYGLAIAGVVNLKTVKPDRNRTSIGEDILAGSYGLRRYTTHFESSSDKSSILANYSYQHADGFVNHTASTKRFVNVAGDFYISPRQTLNTYFGYSNSYDERQGELTLGQFDAGDYSGNPQYLLRNAHSAVRSVRGGVSHTYQFSDAFANTTTVFGSGAYTDAASAAGWTDKNPVNFGLRSTFNSNLALTNNISISGITGVETQHEYAQSIGYTMRANPRDPLGYYVVDTARSNVFNYNGTTSVFTEWTLGLPQDLSITAGLGWNTMNIHLEDRFRPVTKPVVNFDTSYNAMFSPHIAINKVVSKQVSVYASWSRGYKAPVSSYFYIPFVTGAPNTGRVNDSLKPEQGDQFEIGSKGALFHDRLNYQVALFDAIYSNKMTTVAVPLDPNTTAYSYIVNGGRQEDRGVELALNYLAYESKYDLFSMIRPFVNVTYSDFVYKNYQFQRFKVAPNTTKDSTVDYSGKAVAGVPKFMVNAGLDFATKPGIYGNVVYTYKDPVPITSDNLNYTSSYNLLNAKLGFRRGFGHIDLDAYIGASNITGTKYYYMIFVNQLPDAYLPAPTSINYFGGINLKYNF